jgi:hypothetical protein
MKLRIQNSQSPIINCAESLKHKVCITVNLQPFTSSKQIVVGQRKNEHNSSKEK